MKFTPLPDDIEVKKDKPKKFTPLEEIAVKFPKKEEPKQGFNELRLDPLTPSTVSQLPEDQPKTRTSIMDELLAMRKVAAIPAEMSKEGLTQLTDMIPEPQTKSALLNTALGIPKTSLEVVADMAPTFIHPDVAIGAGVLKGAGKAAATPAAKKVFTKLGEKIPEGVKKAFTYRYGQPKEYVDIAEQAEINMRVGTERVGEVGKTILNLPKKAQQNIGSYLKGDTAIKLSEGEKVAADAARVEFKQLGKDAVELGLLDEATYLANVETYLPTMYRVKELGKGAKLGTKKPTRMNLDRFKKKQDLSPEVREAYGEILEAGYPTAKGLMQLNQAVEKGKMFQKVSQTPTIATGDKVIAESKGFVQLPTTPKLGKLSGSYVDPAVADDLNAMIKEQGPIAKQYKKLLSMWKFGKVVLSPSTHARNVFTNAFWLDVSGVGPAKQAKLLPKALKEMKSKGLFYKEAKKQGLIGTEMVGADVMRLQEDYLTGSMGNSPFELVKKGLNYAKRAANKMGDAYQGEEQVFKLAKFMDNLAKGMGKKEAALEAEQWIFNYSKISPAVKAARETVIPFATYFSKAIPQLAKAIVQNPLGVYKYTQFFESLENVTAVQNDVSKAERRAIKDQYDVNIIPGKRKDGRFQTLDLDFLTPWGEAAQLSSAGIPQPFTPSGPLFALNNALISHYDPFLKKPIFKESDPMEVKIKNTTDYLGKALLPNLTPGMPGIKSGFRGGYHFQELTDALRGKPSYPKKEAKSIPEALLSTMAGLKTRGVDPKQALLGQAIKQDMTLQELSSTLGTLVKRQELTKSERAWVMDMYTKQIKKKAKPKPTEIFSLRPQIGPLQQGKKIERKFTPLD